MQPSTTTPSSISEHEAVDDLDHIDQDDDQDDDDDQDHLDGDLLTMPGSSTTGKDAKNIYIYSKQLQETKRSW